MKDIHRRIATAALPVGEQYGFVLAGGYALSENGIGNRPSNDVDLFTMDSDPTRFGEAVTAVAAAVEAAGFQVEQTRRFATFADLTAVDMVTGESSDFQLGYNDREYPPARLLVGPVLDIRDAITGKMSALWSRGAARDYIDIDAVLQSGRFTADDVLALGDAVEAQPMDRSVLAQMFRGATRHTVAAYADYGVDAAHRAQIITRFAAWADQIDPAMTLNNTPPLAERTPAWFLDDPETTDDPGERGGPSLTR